MWLPGKTLATIKPDRPEEIIVPVNSRLSVILPFIILVVLFTVCVVRQVNSGTLSLPPQTNDDEWAYDNIAVNISSGKGFGLDYSGSEFRKPYEEHPSPVITEYLLSKQGMFTPTTFRAPLFPYFVAASYTVLGRNFEAVRLVNALFIALTGACACMLAMRISGITAGLFTALFFLIDPAVSYFAALYMSESMAVSLLTVAASIATVKEVSSRTIVILALILALALSCKFIFLFIVPFFAILPFLDRHKSPLTGTLTRSLLLLIIPLIFCSPWFVRNCIVSSHFMPLGTQGWTDFGFDYSDDALKNDGLWSERAMESLLNEPGKTETDRALLSKEKGMSWMHSNIHELPFLISGKIFSLWWKDPLSVQRVYVLIGFTGMLIFFRKRPAQVCLLICLGLTAAVGFTHNVMNGRFLFLVQPLLMALTGAALASLTTVVLKARHRQSRVQPSL